ncbi:Acid phosphatase/vanadium-dependent haloperoxidase-related protein [Euphorbia peplus]|nr:Acid phosphatase/vanadium-dependent haloperoxidase-related protein [Euphorbia peplus]
MASLICKPSFPPFYLHSPKNPFFKFHPPICSSCSNPSNRNNKTFFTTPLSIIIPILQHIKKSASSQTNKWVSQLQSYQDESEAPMEDFSGEFLQNGSLGLALLSITTNAKVRFSPFVATLAGNPTFISGFVAWFVAQSVKVVLNFCVERRWDLRLMFASGGMPSSHSALCTALTTSVAICHGVADSLFPVCLGFTLIVMYDAIGVRRHAGMQAEVLNMIVADLFQGHPISQRKLKELLGHTPSQVFGGAMLGILVACYCCQVT